MADILIIEDEEETRHLLRDVLEQERHTVLEACNGLEGLCHYRASPTDLVVTDLLMPEKEGLETIVELHREFPKVKIIAITGAAMSIHFNLLDTAKKLGAVSTLQKPFRLDDFLNAVDEALES